MPLRQVVVLMTTSPRDIVQETAQRRVLDVLAGKQIDVDVVDGRLQKERREQLWALDGVPRATYPLVFLQKACGETALVADLDVFESAVECSALPPDVLAKNPGILTFEKIFGDVLPLGLPARRLAAIQRLHLAQGTLLGPLSQNSPLQFLPLDLVIFVVEKMGICSELPGRASNTQLPAIWR